MRESYNFEIEKHEKICYIFNEIKYFLRGTAEMLKSSTFGMALIINILIICLWVFVSFVIARSVSAKRVDYRRFPYRVYNWEKKGSFYTDNFDVGAWYGVLPIKFNRDGIDYKTIESADISKLKRYITITCRSELFNILNCSYFIFAVIINVTYLGFIFGSIVVIANIPFIIANRFARFVLLNKMVSKRREQEIESYIASKNNISVNDTDNDKDHYSISDFE